MFEIQHNTKKDKNFLIYVQLMYIYIYSVIYSKNISSSAANNHTHRLLSPTLTLFLTGPRWRSHILVHVFVPESIAALAIVTPPVSEFSFNWFLITGNT